MFIYQHFDEQMCVRNQYRNQQMIFRCYVQRLLVEILVDNSFLQVKQIGFF